MNKATSVEISEMGRKVLLNKCRALGVKAAEHINGVSVIVNGKLVKVLSNSDGGLILDYGKQAAEHASAVLDEFVAKGHAFIAFVYINRQTRKSFPDSNGPETTCYIAPIDKVRATGKFFFYEPEVTEWAVSTERLQALGLLRPQTRFSSRKTLLCVPRKQLFGKQKHI
jgi:hypothetical protein